MPKTKGKGKQAKRPGSAAPSDPGPRNFHPDAGPGCHIALTRHAKWLLGSERFDPVRRCKLDPGLKAPGFKSST